MKNNIAVLLIFSFMNAFLLEEVQSAMTDSSLFIYGTITTTDNESYTGQIRWGKEEAFWFDHFNATKPENDNLKYLSREELDELNYKDNQRNTKWYHNSWTGWNNWNNSSNDNTHVFECHFGDLQAIEPMRGDRLRVTMRNGDVIRLEGGSNDVGATVRIYDEEMGTIKLDWDDIEIVEFSAAPAGLVSVFGEPLYGSVETTSGIFTGYLQWDHDERLTLDELNGESSSGELDIPFRNIRSIESNYRGSTVELKSGRTLKMRGSNDVDDDNRGIIVNMVDMGRVDIPWEEFEKMTLQDVPARSEVSYASYIEQKPITGSVTSIRGDKLSGRMIYDLDENYELEMLNGVNNGIEYFIPFKFVESIVPKNREESLVLLKNGEKILFSDKVDINEGNDGVLVFTSDDEYEYVPWKEVDEIKITNR